MGAFNTQTIVPKVIVARSGRAPGRSGHLAGEKDFYRKTIRTAEVDCNPIVFKCGYRCLPN